MTPERKLSIAVVGAGMAGSAAASVLAGHGFDVAVFEKGRGAGGRMATRREGEREFDHGAPYFTAASDAFQSVVAGWVDAGVVAAWSARLRGLDDTPRYVGVPGMSALCEHLGAGATFIPRVRVAGGRFARGSWHLQGEYASELGEYDGLVVTVAPKQATPLLSQSAGIRRQMRAVEMTPCWAVMAAFGDPVEVDWDVAAFPGSAVSLAVRNSAKPGRPPGEAWVFHASPEWTQTHLEGDPAHVAERLLHEFFAAVDVPRPRPDFIAAHRWRYSASPEPLGDGFLWDSRVRLGVCADWCHGGGVEGAWLSAAALAGRMARSLER